MITKIKIDLANGLVEVEGSEEFVRSVYDDFREKLASEPTALRTPTPPPPAHQGERSESNGARAKSAAGVKKRAQSVAATGAAPKKSLDEPSVVKSLDLVNGPGGRLRDFYNQYEVKTNFERNLIFLYFLQQKMGRTGITQDEVFTCYRDIPGIKAPVALRQGLLDTDQKRNWIDVADPNDLKVTVHGVNHLENDLQKKVV